MTNRSKLIWAYAAAALSVLTLLTSAMSWLENEPKRKLEGLGYQQVNVFGEVPGCKDGRGYSFNATGPQGGYRLGVLCIYKDHETVTITGRRNFHK